MGREVKTLTSNEFPIGYQLYETTSSPEGSPISPIFETPEELADWLTKSEETIFAKKTLSFDKWMEIIKSQI